LGKKPTAKKKLEGTYRKDRAPKNEMQPSEANTIDKPVGLINEFADNIWLKVTGELSSLNMLMEVDKEMLMAYCNEMGIYFDCCEKTKATGSYTQDNKANGEIISNFMKIGNTALANAIKLSDKFGFNPAARTKIEMPEKTKKNGLDKF
jgi:P27 family predicted phage terminase small subunit|tara:strand:+ start:108 stop:554 length:447 start_codon:yes stop_codon:yes gene_type:complete